MWSFSVGLKNRRTQFESETVHQIKKEERDMTEEGRVDLVSTMFLCTDCGANPMAQDRYALYPLDRSGDFWIARCSSPNCTNECFESSPEKAVELWNALNYPIGPEA